MHWQRWRTSQGRRSRTTGVASETRAAEAYATERIVAVVVVVVAAVVDVFVVERRAAVTAAVVELAASCTALPGVG